MTYALKNKIQLYFQNLKLKLCHHQSPTFRFLLYTEMLSFPSLTSEIGFKDRIEIRLKIGIKIIKKNIEISVQNGLNIVKKM